MKTPIITRDQRYELVAAIVTLDGKPAKISGALLPFATVATLPFGAVVEFSWPTVARIVAAGGAFKTITPTPAKRAARTRKARRLVEVTQ